MEPLIQEARSGETRLFFLDAAHFVYGAFQGYLWSFDRVFVKTGSGRQRFNVLGAYDPINQELVTVENEDVVNSKTIWRKVQLFRLILRVITENILKSWIKLFKRYPSRQI